MTASLWLICIQLQAQQIILFDKVALEFGGDSAAGFSVRVESDSQNIYVLGHLPKTIAGSNKYSHPVFGSLSYQGEVKSVQIPNDSAWNESFYDNSHMIRKNDSVYIGLCFVPIPNNNNWSASELFEMDVKNAKILNRKAFYDYQKYSISFIFSVTRIKDSVFQLILASFSEVTSKKTFFLYEIDLNLNIIRKINLDFGSSTSNYRWASRNDEGNYELIEENIYRDLPVKVQLTYVKVDSNGNVLKRKDLPINGNFGLVSGDSWTIHREEDGSFVIGCIDYFRESSQSISKPYLIKVSPEFDELRWSIKYYPFSTDVYDPRFYIQDLAKLKDGSGYLLCGSWIAVDFSVPDYGLLMKASPDGDSLWTRKYIPVGWDSLRALAITLNQMSITPYNTIAIVGAISDRLSGWWHPYVLNLDADGCLIPGCGELVHVQDIQNGRHRAFEIYPNPIKGDKLYVLSRISASESFSVKLSDLSGKAIHKASLSPQSGNQYVFEVPSDLQPGHYVLQIASKDYTQNEKIELIK